MKIMLLIRSLNVGGAERQLLLLARELSERGHLVCVVTFYDRGAFVASGAAKAVRIVSLKKRGRWDTVGFCWRLFQIIRQEAPAVIYSFLTVANVLALIGRLIPNRPKIVWGVRASAMNAREYDWLVAFSLRLERLLSGFADLIIFNSRVAMNEALAGSCGGSRCRVIPNGIDTRAFFRDSEAGDRFRNHLALARTQKLVGIVARLDPMKGHQVFLQAAAIVAAKRPDARFVCVGDGDPGYKLELERLADTLRLQDRLYWLTRANDLNAVYSGLDVLCLASVFGEGFPNVVGEAMACELPCVVTRVGDAGEIVGRWGRVVPPHNPDELAAAIIAVLDADRRSANLRSHIESTYSVSALVTQTERQLEELVGRHSRSQPA